MLRFAAPVTLRLERGHLLSWSRQSGVCLHVIAGTAWVTQADDAEDHFLQPGQSLRLRNGSRAIIGAEQDLSLRFENEGGVDLTAVFRRLRRVFEGRARAGVQLAR